MALTIATLLGLFLLVLWAGQQAPMRRRRIDRQRDHLEASWRKNAVKKD